jgi:hypothetical protein
MEARANAKTDISRVGFRTEVHGEESPWNSPVSQTDLSEIRALMLLKEIDPDELRKFLRTSGVERIEDLRLLAVRNFLLYLRAL